MLEEVEQHEVGVGGQVLRQHVVHKDKDEDDGREGEERQGNRPKVSQRRDLHYLRPFLHAKVFEDFIKKLQTKNI